ncbi:MAG: YneF family protein [Erysipelotrichales bacterium]|nr:MAG: YneF family protein [Erysipelotrichales bacterium]
MNDFWLSIINLLIGGVIGGGLGFYFTRKMLMKQLKENPPINEKMIRAMFLQMGRKPSEAQIKQIMKSMGQYR